MHFLTLRLIVALITFLIGITAVSLYVIHRSPPPVGIKLEESHPASIPVEQIFEQKQAENETQEISSERIYRKGEKSLEVLLSETENAYNPIPNPDGSLIAYVRTGWGRPGGSGGFGRSNLQSEVLVMSVDGRVLIQKPLADAFLAGWTAGGQKLICYRDWKYSLVSLRGDRSSQGEIPGDAVSPVRTERATYLSSTGSMIWVQSSYPRETIETPKGVLAQHNAPLGEMLVPSPDEKYIAAIGTGGLSGNSHLWVYDREAKSWADLGTVIIHPDPEWDYIKPTWNPWFADSSRLVYISTSGIVISSPDGKNKEVVSKPNGAAGLAVPSPDGKYIAYATFEGRPMNNRPDLKFWGGSTIWVIPTTAQSKARSITKKDRDTTYCLRWLNNQQLVFDRIADEIFYKHARLWKVNMPG